MPLFYNRLYKVPCWIVVNLPKEKARPIVQEFKEMGAHEVKWIADTFPLTINDLARHGWAHEVNQPMPFKVNQDFLFVAMTKHIKQYGLNKTLSGTPERPVSSLNRTVNSGDDYVRLFNDVLSSEPAIHLSHLFDVGEMCHQDGSSVKIFISFGPTAPKVLQKLTERVITIGADGDSLVVDGCVKDDPVYDMILSFAQMVGYMP